MNIVLAVSGGVDSMVLLHLVLQTHPKDKITVAYFDHSLRGEESVADGLFIANICNKIEVNFITEKMDIGALAQTEKMSIEAVARKYRYLFLLESAKGNKASYILTAHHLDDRIETSLFNLIRGSKLGGINALTESINLDSDISLFRPLLDLPKSEIIEYAEKNYITFRQDSTNSDTKYLRNHLRQIVLPEFGKINPEYRNAIRNFMDYTEEMKDWIDAEIQKFLGSEKKFSLLDFSKQSIFFQKEIIRYLYEKTNQGTIGLSEGNIDELLRYILTANGGTRKELGCLVLKREKGNIIFSRRNR